MSFLGGDIAGGKIQCRLRTINLSSKIQKRPQCHQALVAGRGTASPYIFQPGQEVEDNVPVNAGEGQFGGSNPHLIPHISHENIERLFVGEDRIFAETALPG